jgi:epoxyqueuosine reductase
MSDTQYSISGFIKQEAKNLGFFDCGISKVRFLKEDAERVEQWLENGHHATMNYMERNREKRYNPAVLVESAKSVISVLYNYYPKTKIPEKNNYKISKYAYGKDYHFIIKEKLNRLLLKIEEKTGKRTARIFVDSAPVLDRAWAAQSGLGFIGKNTLLINKKGGSFFFIGQIIIDLELQYNEHPDFTNHCGTCTACIDACPTQAIKPFEVDAGKCISFLTIENRNEIPPQFKGKLKNRIFGCDICQDVCPWNLRFARPHNEPLFEPSEQLLAMRKPDWENLDKPTFKKLFKHTPVERTGYKGLMRNIKYISGK